MTLRPNTLLSASTRAFAAFVATDFLLEYLLERLLNIRVKDLLVHAELGLRFTVTYFLVLLFGVVLTMIVYVLLRPRFSSRWRAGLATGVVMYLYTGLLMTQLLNFGLMPPMLFAISAGVNIVELPIALFVGIVSYREPSAV